MSETENWAPCLSPEIGDVLKWKEPLWAEPNKPRGKRDQIGEQEIIASLAAMDEVFELKVISIEKISPADAPIKVKEGDSIRRKKTSLERGDCHKKL